MGPGLGPGAVTQPGDRFPQGGSPQRPGQERQLGADVPLGLRGLGGGGHHAAPPPVPSAAS